MTNKALRQLWTRLGIPADVAQRGESRLHPEAKRLVFIGRAQDDGKILRLTPRAALAWHAMQSAAATDGLTLLPLSAFRSVARQTAIVRRKLACGQTIAAILRVSAIPGCSEHHTGRALDLGSPAHLQLTGGFARTREFRWLQRHAGRFNFFLSYPRPNPHGINYEPWHWCWRPGGSRPGGGLKTSSTRRGSR